MAGEVSDLLRSDLVDRRERLHVAVSRGGEEPQLRALLGEVDAALARMERGTYGLCEECHDPIEADRLRVDPLIRRCLDHLTAAEQRTLDMDLELASRIQHSMLPKCGLGYAGWDVSHHFEPFGHVGGDYCDVVVPEEGGDAFFLLGDVSGKGVAASLLMASLHATFRSLIAAGLPAERLVERANRVFCQSLMPAHYATLVCCRALASGQVHVANAGHPPALLVRQGGIEAIGATGLPLGMFCSSAYASQVVMLEPGDLLLLYTDGLIETENEAGEDYGLSRLQSTLRRLTTDRAAPVDHVVARCVDDLNRFRGTAPRADDLTVMGIRRLD